MELPLGPINTRILLANNFFMLPNRILVWREVRGAQRFIGSREKPLCLSFQRLSVH